MSGERHGQSWTSVDFLGTCPSIVSTVKSRILDSTSESTLTEDKVVIVTPPEIDGEAAVYHCWMFLFYLTMRPV